MAEQKSQENAGSEKAALLELAQSLIVMRDALMETSLMLHDAYFDCAVEHRDAAAEHLKTVIQKIITRW